MWLNAWGEIAEELAAHWIDLLGQEADVIDEGGSPFEYGPGANGLACQVGHLP
jgi:hypothetical protein